MTAKERIGLALQPLDTLFFRDGRPFTAASRVESGLPLPQTFAGALTTWLLGETGADIGALTHAVRSGTSFRDALAAQGSSIAWIADCAFRGPYFALRNNATTQYEPLVPVPATLLRDEERNAIIRIDPLKQVPLPGWEGRDPGMLPLWHRSRGKTRRVQGYLLPCGVRRFLEGSVPEESDIVPAEHLYGIDARTGIGVDPERLTAGDGRIYGVGLLALQPGVSLYAEVVGDRERLRGMRWDAALPLGGEGRRVAMRPAQAFDWPAMQPRAGQGALVVLTVPGCLESEWRPAGATLVAAAVPGYRGVSGWDLARGGPKQCRFAVAAGSVYFLAKPLGSSSGSLCNAEDARLGWGTFLEGVWKHV